MLHKWATCTDKVSINRRSSFANTTNAVAFFSIWTLIFLSYKQKIKITFKWFLITDYITDRCIVSQYIVANIRPAINLSCCGKNLFIYRVTLSLSHGQLLFESNLLSIFFTYLLLGIDLYKCEPKFTGKNIIIEMTMDLWLQLNSTHQNHHLTPKTPKIFLPLPPSLPSTLFLLPSTV